MKIIFMGTPEFAVPALKELIASQHQIIAVYTQPPKPAGRGYKEKISPVHQVAVEAGLTVKHPASLRNAEAQQEFSSLNADIAVIAAYGLILPQPILDAPQNGCINIHPSLLPRWRGAAPIQRTVLAGDRETGVCIMKMDVGLDTGPILTCEQIKLDENITSTKLHDMLAQQGANLLVKTIDNLDNITPQTQSEIGVTYAKKLTKEESVINWNLPAIEIDRLVRGLNPWPGAHFIFKDERIKIIEGDFKNQSINQLPGTVIDNQLTIACMDGLYIPVIVQREGKAKMPASDLLRGLPITAGTILN